MWAWGLLVTHGPALQGSALRISWVVLQCWWRRAGTAGHHGGKGQVPLLPGHGQMFVERWGRSCGADGGIREMGCLAVRMTLQQAKLKRLSAEQWQAHLANDHLPFHRGSGRSREVAVPSEGGGLRELHAGGRLGRTIQERSRCTSSRISTWQLSCERSRSRSLEVPAMEALARRVRWAWAPEGTWTGSTSSRKMGCLRLESAVVEPRWDCSWSEVPAGHHGGKGQAPLLPGHGQMFVERIKTLGSG